MPDPNEVQQLQADLLRLHEELNESVSGTNEHASLVNSVLDATTELLGAEKRLRDEVIEEQRQAGEGIIRRITGATAIATVAAAVVPLAGLTSRWLVTLLPICAAALFARYVEPREGHRGQNDRRAGTIALAVAAAGGVLGRVS